MVYITIILSKKLHTANMTSKTTSEIRYAIVIKQLGIINNQPINIDGVYIKLKLLLNKLSKITCTIIMIVAFVKPNFLEYKTIKNIVNWTPGILDNSCSWTNKIDVITAIIAISFTLIILLLPAIYNKSIFF